MSNWVEIKTIKLAAWDDTSKQQAIAFWSARKFKILETSPYTLEGKRGSLLGNLFGVDSRRLIALLATTWDDETKLLHTSFRVNTFAQDITEWNTEYWKLELESFELYLLFGDEDSERWEKFLTAFNKGFVKFLLARPGGKTILPEDRTW